MAPAVVPTSIKAPMGQPWVELCWSDGERHRIPTAVLRGYCPCASCQGHSGPIRFTAGHDSELRDLAQVGNYALRFEWGDGHGTGIYPFRYLRTLGELHEAHGDELPQSVPELGRM